jgi:5-(aminomethyl)-3-furanmethanol phosphate kinase
MKRPPVSRRAPFRWDLVVKIGGSLGRGHSLRAAVEGLASLARHARILAVPGGGRFADLVRREQRRLGLDEASAHRVALRAMDQYGLVIGGLCRAARPVESLDEARREARRGRLPVLLAAATVDRARGLERTFRLTSDSIAAYLAGRERAPRLVLMKSCAGSRLRVPGRSALVSLAERAIVDPLFPALAPEGCEIFIVNGRRAVAWERILRGPTGAQGPQSAKRKSRRRSASSGPLLPPRQRAPRAPTRSGPRARTRAS